MFLCFFGILCSLEYPIFKNGKNIKKKFVKIFAKQCWCLIQVVVRLASHTASVMLKELFHKCDISPLNFIIRGN